MSALRVQLRAGGPLGVAVSQARRVVMRNFAGSGVARHGDYPEGPEALSIKWVHKDGSETVTRAAVGATLLQVAHRYDIELEGACGGVCACSTCHVYIPADVFSTLPEATEEEEDMLDRAFAPTATSRLACQVKLEDTHNGMVIRLPKATRNFYVDGHVPKPH